MEGKPLITLNLIDKLMHVESPSTASSSHTNDTAENGQHLCDAATDLTLHQSLLQLASTTNKRKAETSATLQHQDIIDKPDAINPKKQKLVLSDHEIMESNMKTDEVTRCDDHDGENLHDHHNDKQVVRDPALYNVKKKLTTSDILPSASRLLMPKEMVRNHVLPLVDSDFVQKLESRAGVQVTVKDSETETEHQLTFKYLRSSKCYVFNGKWLEFVTRRALKKDDEIGLYWDTHHSKFHFSVLKVAGQ